jgi:hypothetical protein
LEVDGVAHVRGAGSSGGRRRGRRRRPIGGWRGTGPRGRGSPGS